jgi:hypothetical protein
MADNKKYFLDLIGLNTLWNKLKKTFASKTEVNLHIAALQADIDGVETLTLSYAPKVASNYTEALNIAKAAPAGTVIVVGENESVNDVIYVKGLYIIDNDKLPHYIGTSSGNASTEEIAVLRSRVSALENEIIKAASIVDGDGNQLSGITIANNSLVMIYDDEVVADSESINALTHRAIAAKFGELENRITSIPKFKIEVVDALPESQISLTTIYLVKSDETSDNMYTEYIYVQSGSAGHWEALGSQVLALDNYVTKEFLNKTLQDSLNNYAKKSDITAVKTEILETVAENYALKTDVLTEQDIITSITEGNIGNSIMITDEQIEQLA